MAVSLTGSTGAEDAVGGTTQLVVTRTCAAGALLILHVGWLAGDSTTITIADSAGNTWLKASKGDKTGSTGTRAEIWYVINAAAITSVTITQSAATIKSAVLEEFAGFGAGALKVGDTNTVGGTATPALTNTIVPNAGDLVVANMNLNNVAAITVVTTGSWVADPNPQGTLAGDRCVPAYKLSGTTSESESWTFAAGTKNWGATIAAFTPAGAGLTTDQLAGLWPTDPQEQRRNDQSWFTPDDGYEATPPELVTIASVAQQAGLWPEQPQEQVSNAPTWYQPDALAAPDLLYTAGPTNVVVTWSRPVNNGTGMQFRVTWDDPPGIPVNAVDFTLWLNPFFDGTTWGSSATGVAPTGGSHSFLHTLGLANLPHAIQYAVQAAWKAAGGHKAQDAGISAAQPYMVGAPSRIGVSPDGYSSALSTSIIVPYVDGLWQDNSGQQDRPNAQQWFQPDDAYEATPPFAPTTATVAQQAGLWGSSGQEQVSNAPSWFAAESSREGPTPPGGAFDPAPIVPAITGEQPQEQVRNDQSWFAAESSREGPTPPAVPPFDPTSDAGLWQEQPGQEAGNGQVWFTPELDTLGIPPFAFTIATVAQQAALWQEQPGQEKALGPTWFTPDDDYLARVPPFVPSLAFASLAFDPEVRWRVDFTPDAIQEQFAGELQSWLLLVWGQPAPTTGGTPAILIDATTGDPYVYLGGAIIARVD